MTEPTDEELRLLAERDYQCSWIAEALLRRRGRGLSDDEPASAASHHGYDEGDDSSASAD